LCWHGRRLMRIPARIRGFVEMSNDKSQMTTAMGR
jgi:hypothetical protein